MEKDKFLDYFDDHLDGKKQCLTEIICERGITNCATNLRHYGDYFFPINIKIKKLHDPYKLTNLYIRIGNDRLVSIPVRLLIQLSGLHYDNDHYYINLEPKFFFRNKQNKFYLLPLLNYNIMLEGIDVIDYTIEVLYYFSSGRIIGELSYLINSYYSDTVRNSEIYVNGSVNYSPGFFVETSNILENITIKNADLIMQVYNKFVINSFKIKTNDWDAYQKYSIKKIISKVACRDVANVVMSYISPSIYLYYIPFDITNKKYDIFNEDTVLYNGSVLNRTKICFGEKIDAVVTFASLDKITIGPDMYSPIKHNETKKNIEIESLV